MLQKIRFVRVSLYIFQYFCKGGEHHFKVINPLPSDARLIRSGHDIFGEMRLIFMSEQFEEIENGAEIPEHKIQFEKITSSA